MVAFLIYMLKVNLAITLLYCFYRLLFSKDTFFRLRRFTLLSIYAIAFLYPLPDMTSLFVSGEFMSEAVVYYVDVVGDSPVEEVVQNIVGWKGILLILGLLIYWSGVFLLLYRCMSELIAVFRLRIHCSSQVRDEVTVYFLKNREEPFSFFRWIFISPEKHDEYSYNEILIHESSHARQIHSADILISEWVRIICWINPFAWLLRKEVSINHEFLADQEVVRAGYDRKTYQYHLIGLEHPIMAAAKLYNHFSVLPLKKRITMLNKKKTKSVCRLKYLALVPLAMSLLLVNCIDKKAKEVAEESVVEASNVPVVGEALADPFHDLEGVYDIDKCDVTPAFPGGDGELMKYINQNIKYPIDAQENGKEGRVIVSFLVEDDGSLSNIQVIRGVYKSIDEESIRVIKSMPKWRPGEIGGKKVRVKYTMPLMYRLQ